jgi:hypothetical protein
MPHENLLLLLLAASTQLPAAAVAAASPNLPRLLLLLAASPSLPAAAGWFTSAAAAAAAAVLAASPLPAVAGCLVTTACWVPHQNFPLGHGPQAPEPSSASPAAQSHLQCSKGKGGIRPCCCCNKDVQS